MMLSKLTYMVLRSRRTSIARDCEQKFPISTVCNHTRSNAPFRLAIVGSGPAGFYTAYRVMGKLPNVHIDMFESLPVPFGLVRYGVAPDHPEVKNCQDKFEEVASSPNFRFLGNVSIGRSCPSAEHCVVELQSLQAHYDSVLLAYGASEDKRLGIPGESTLKGIFSARQFVGWYNGLPECSSLKPNLACAEEAIIIGQGNVALDVARILLADIDVLRRTDITESALAVLASSRIKRVHVIGRRGPMQAAFTIKEVRELMNLADVAFHPVDRSMIPKDINTLSRAPKRLMEVILNGSSYSTTKAPKAWSLVGCLSPRRFVANKDDPTWIQETEFEVTSLQAPFDPHSTTVSTGKIRTLPSDVVFRSVGYKSGPLSGFRNADIDFDESRGIVKNDGLGRATYSAAKYTDGVSAEQIPGIYCAGWVKSGPTGVIASTMQDAFLTGDTIVQDWMEGRSFLRSGEDITAGGWDAIRHELGSRANQAISWNQWRKIDSAERERGRSKGKKREKFTSITEMLAVVGD